MTPSKAGQEGSDSSNNNPAIGKSGSPYLGSAGSESADADLPAPGEPADPGHGNPVDPFVDLLPISHASPEPEEHGESSVGGAIAADPGSDSGSGDPSENIDPGNDAGGGIGGEIPSLLQSGANSGFRSGRIGSSINPPDNGEQNSGTGSGGPEDPSDNSVNQAEGEDENSTGYRANSGSADGENNPSAVGGSVATPGDVEPSYHPAGDDSSSSDPQESNEIGTSGKFIDPLAVVGGQTVSVDPGLPGAVVIGSHTLDYGSSTVIRGTTVSVGELGLVIDGQAVQTIPMPTATGAIINLGSLPFTAIDQSGHVVVGSRTLSPGGSAITVSGTTVTMAPSGLVVDGTTHSFSKMLDVAAKSGEFSLNTAVVTGTMEEQAIFTDGEGHVHTALEDLSGSKTAILDGSITLSVGGSAEKIDGETVSLGSNGLILDGTSSVEFAVVATAASASTSSGSSNGISGGTDHYTTGPSATETLDLDASSATRGQEFDLKSWILCCGVGVVLFLVVLPLW